MRIAFYAPLKAPDHPVPSGDRLMARQLVQAMRLGGHEVAVASDLRSFAREPDAAIFDPIVQAAEGEVRRIAAEWEAAGAPDLWLSYHPYYKSPDLIGPPLARRFGLPYVTVESSYAPRRERTAWAARQDLVREGVALAAANICLTARDRDGLLAAVPSARVAELKPFLDTAPFAGAVPEAAEWQGLIAVAMMRPGDKMQSYQMLAAALARLPVGLPWQLTVVGDGPVRAEVEALFAFAPACVRWAGQLSTPEIAGLLRTHALHVWPGFGEAYGLAYLEAQACGLPVVAQEIAGVPEVVRQGRTGILTPPGDVAAYAAAIARLLTRPEERAAMGAEARRFVLQERSLSRAAEALDGILRSAVAQGPAR